MFEIYHASKFHMEYNIPKSMAVYIDEMRRTAEELTELTRKSPAEGQYIVPEISTPAAYRATAAYIKFSVGGHVLIENLDNICEVFWRSHADIDTGTVNFRGNILPVINCNRRFNLKSTGYDESGQEILIISRGLEYAQPYGKDAFALPIDDLDIKAVFYSQAGISVPPRKEHAFADYALECWDTVDGGQLIIADWDRIKSIC
jgi:chemotaxis signal transduction protein